MPDSPGIRKSGVDEQSDVNPISGDTTFIDSSLLQSERPDNKEEPPPLSERAAFTENDYASARAGVLHERKMTPPDNEDTQQPKSDIKNDAPHSAQLEERSGGAPTSSSLESLGATAFTEPSKTDEILHAPAEHDVPQQDSLLPSDVPPNKQREDHSTEDPHKLRSSSTHSQHSASKAEAEKDDASNRTGSEDSGLDERLRDEIHKKWILTLSMHFRDGTRREKFFVTYLRAPNDWLRVSVSIDYCSKKGKRKRTKSESGQSEGSGYSKTTSVSEDTNLLDTTYSEPEPGSLEHDLMTLTYQRDKNFFIYKAVHKSLGEIHFFDTITNLKLETIDERLHIHVAEDANERIPYPPLSILRHLDSNPYKFLQVPEKAVFFEGHLSGFVYKVNVGGKTFVKKEITSIDTVQEFVYEIEALATLRDSKYVIDLIGVVVGGDEKNRCITGVLLDYASGGALNDYFYDYADVELDWNKKMRWIWQIVKGLADIHEAGFVQGDCTLSNVVLDAEDNAKIVDINRRGCPIGWEPPEFRPKIQDGQRISMFIGNKSDLYQMGMVIWAIAHQYEEPDRAERPLEIEDLEAPSELKEVVNSCLDSDPVDRRSAKELLTVLKPFHMYNIKPMGIADMSDMPTREEIRASRMRPQRRGSRGVSQDFDGEDFWQQQDASEPVEQIPEAFIGLSSGLDDPWSGGVYDFARMGLSDDPPIAPGDAFAPILGQENEHFPVEERSDPAVGGLAHQDSGLADVEHALRRRYSQLKHHDTGFEDTPEHLKVVHENDSDY